jgi:hypothetical protein
MGSPHELACNAMLVVPSYWGMLPPEEAFRLALSAPATGHTRRHHLHEAHSTFTTPSSSSP